jgi:hypothetical protein
MVRDQEKLFGRLRRVEVFLWAPVAHGSRGRLRRAGGLFAFWEHGRMSACGTWELCAPSAHGRQVIARLRRMEVWATAALGIQDVGRLLRTEIGACGACKFRRWRRLGPSLFFYYYLALGVGRDWDTLLLFYLYLCIGIRPCYVWFLSISAATLKSTTDGLRVNF